MMEFSVFHDYRRLARRGFVKPLTHSCGEEYTLGIGKDDEPVLKCFGCNATVVPGASMYRDIVAVVKEHFQ